MEKRGPYTAWGQTHTFREWKADPRVCQNLSHTLLSRRLRLGWGVEEALSTPVRGYTERTIDGLPIALVSKETGKPDSTLRGRLRNGEKDPVNKPRGAHSDNMVTAWGETKPFWEWLRDPRTSKELTPRMFSSRKHGGWTMEAALSTPRKRRKVI